LVGPRAFPASSLCVRGGYRRAEKAGVGGPNQYSEFGRRFLTAPLPWGRAHVAEARAAASSFPPYGSSIEMFPPRSRKKQGCGLPLCRFMAAALFCDLR